MQPETANDIPAAAKTGTTSDFRDYNFVGLTPTLSLPVWWGYDQPRDMRAEGAKDGKPTQYLWKYLVEDVLADAPYADFPMADGVCDQAV